MKVLGIDLCKYRIYYTALYYEEFNLEIKPKLYTRDVQHVAHLKIHAPLFYNYIVEFYCFTRKGIFLAHFII